MMEREKKEEKRKGRVLGKELAEVATDNRGAEFWGGLRGGGGGGGGGGVGWNRGGISVDGK